MAPIVPPRAAPPPKAAARSRVTARPPWRLPPRPGRGSIRVPDHRRDTMFKALLLEKDDAGFRAGLTSLDESRLPGWDQADVLVQPEYSTVNYKDALALTNKAPGGARLAHGARHRRRRHRARKPPPRLAARRPLRAQRLGRGRDALGLPGRTRPAQGRLAGEAARRLHAAPGHGHRHRGLHRHAVRAGAGAPRPAARRRRRARHRRHRRRRQRGHRAAVAAGPPRHRGQRQAAGSRLPEGAGCRGGDRPRRIRRRGQAAAEGALGRRGRRAGQPHAGQRAGADTLRRRGGGLRPGAGHGPAGRAWRRSSCAVSRWPAWTA